MPKKIVDHLELYGKINDLTQILKRTILLEEIPTPNVNQRMYHLEPYSITLDISYKPDNSSITMYGSSEKLSKLEPIIQSALEEIAQKH